MKNALRTSILTCIFGAFFTIGANAQDSGETPADERATEEKRLKIVPLAVVQPGETRELLLATWCTVGITRGGGFGLTEMRDGKPVGGGHSVKSYSEGGVTITVPDFEKGVEFASLPEFAALKELKTQAFKVTITASEDAKPGKLLDMHLVDSTCAGHCKTDFRVLVIGRK